VNKKRRRTTSKKALKTETSSFPPGRTLRVLGMGLLGFPPATPLGAICPGGSRTPVPDGTQAGLTSVFGMGTGVTPPLWSPKAGPRL